jgi:hypothetical protein
MTDAIMPDATFLASLLTELRLPSIARNRRRIAEAADRDGWPARKTIAAPMEIEVAERASRRIQRHRDQSEAPAGKTFASFDFDAAPALRKQHLLALGSGGARLLPQPMRQLVGERIELARPVSDVELRLLGFRAQVSAHRVARQSRAPGYLADREKVSKRQRRMTLNSSMSITPSPPGQAKRIRFEHGSVLGGKTRAAWGRSQWKSTFDSTNFSKRRFSLASCLAKRLGARDWQVRECECPHPYRTDPPPDGTECRS